MSICHARVLVLMAGLCLHGTSQAALFAGQADAVSGTTTYPDIHDVQDFSDTAPGQAQASSWAEETQALAEAAASTRVNNAGIHLNAFSYAFVSGATGLSGGSYANAYGLFEDRFFIDVGSCPLPSLCAAGMAARMTVALDISGSLNGGGAITTAGTLFDGQWNGSASWSSALTLTAADYSYSSIWRGGQKYEAREDWSGFSDSLDIAEDGYPLANLGRQLITVDFIFGDELELSLLATVTSVAGVRADSYVTTDANALFQAALGNTIAWGGIVDLRDSAGNLITDFTALSGDTGFDYRYAYTSAIPVPAAVWLFGSGLLSLIGIARRRSH